jgi:hypothetical protein
MAGSGVAAAEIFQFENIRIVADGGVVPDKLPKKVRAPITLNTSADISTTDGKQPPIPQHVKIQFDAAGTMYNKGLPTCPTSRIENTTTVAALAACKKALVGIGYGEAQVALPGQGPFPASSKVYLFNGNKQGRADTAVFHAYAFVPAPTTFVVPAIITNAPGAKFGKQVDIDVPPIAGGYGYITHFEMKVKRFFKFKKKKHSYILARCDDFTLSAYGEVTFDGGQLLQGSVVRPCTVRAGRKK